MNVNSRHMRKILKNFNSKTQILLPSFFFFDRPCEPGLPIDLFQLYIFKMRLSYTFFCVFDLENQRCMQYYFSIFSQVLSYRTQREEHLSETYRLSKKENIFKVFVEFLLQQSSTVFLT